MCIRLDVSLSSINKNKEELCGDTVEVVNRDDAEMIILSDGMGSGVKANILSTLTTKILGTMLKNGERLEDCVETIAKTLPISRERDLAYSTFAILSVYRNGETSLIEYDTPKSIFIHDGRNVERDFTERVIFDKKIREYHFKMEHDDCIVMMSDGVTHAGLGGEYSFGWGRTRVSEFVEAMFSGADVTSARITSAVLNETGRLYRGRVGDDSTVVTASAVHRRDINIFTGPPQDRDDDEKLIKDFMDSSGSHIICGGTSASIASRVLKKPLLPSLFYDDPDIPPTAELEGMDLVTEGVLTLNRAVSLMQTYNSGVPDSEFYRKLDAANGGSELAKMIIEGSTDIHLFVGRAMNAAHQAKGLPFDLSIRMRLVDKIIEEGKKMGKTVNVHYY